MFCRIITLRFNPVLDGFDDQPLRELLAHWEVISINDHFFEQQGIAYLSLVICYRPAPLSPPSPNPMHGEKATKDESWRELLTPDEWPLFNSLRDWRSGRSKDEGVPPYVICNNRQLAEIVKARPQSLAALRIIDGFGDAKIKKYGRAMLAVLGVPVAQTDVYQPSAASETLNASTLGSGGSDGKR
ncbi:MAG: HRDC domain protein [Candidatus Methylumidiphilus alinenensis]|uniref:HRDC domain protein n=1 Tax=Candidatus Methylumidiphilus alinenensis TaxID=2202197 RepID=A0A2W4SEJ9_9GAMM|nr:MAG: HRDC domain protein [Candidatus Methylumidiphilus alinenensis]